MLALVRAIYAALEAAGMAGLGVTGIFEDKAKAGQEFPYIIISEQSALDGYSHDRRSHTDYVYSIKCVDSSLSAIRCREISEAIDAALTLQPLTVTGYTAFFVRRTSQFAYTEERDGQFYRHRGGQYAMMLSPNI